MWSDKNSNTAKTAKAAKQKTQLDTLIGQHMRIQGDLHFSGGLHIDGHVQGNITADDGTDSIVTLGVNARVEGQLQVPRIVINGYVQGDVVASKRVELAEKAEISGNVYYNLIEMVIGAKVNGKLVNQLDSKPMLTQLPEGSDPAVDDELVSLTSVS